MSSKRFFAMLLAVLMVLSVLAPAAAAAEINGAVINLNSGNQSGTNVRIPENDRVVSGEDAASGLLNLRDNPLLGENLLQNNLAVGSWEATLADRPTAPLFQAEGPECLDVLKEAAEYYDDDDVVVAFVVMEGGALADTHTHVSEVPASVENQMLSRQNAVINTIEQLVLGGEKLTVRYQFTYLTNAISIETAFGNLDEIAMVSGVKSVYLMPVYEACEVQEGTAFPATAGSSMMTGVTSVWEELGYTGAGMKIAIIDTGLDMDHPAFAADPVLTEDSLTAEYIDTVLTELNAYALRGSVTGETLYRSAKVPFAFNYVDENLTADHSMDGQGDHGTHVAGIAAANPVEGSMVSGMAPDAQIIVMKVFGANGGAYMDDVVAALEDAMILGCDVANASLGSAAGFSSSEDPEQEAIYARIVEQDMVVTFSAGNEGTSSYDNMWGTDLNRTDNPDNSAVGSPSTYPNVMSIASAENSVVMTENFTLAGGSTVFYMNCIEALYGSYYGYDYAVPLEALAGETFEYVIVPGLGAWEDFFDAEGNSIVEGKVAVIHRGELAFGEKVANATAAGAVAVIIWNNNDTDDIFTFGMTTEMDNGDYAYIPAVLITQADGHILAEAEDKTLTVSEQLAPRFTATGGQMSSFSSWGAAPDLRLLPDITGIGGNVYSCYDGGMYGLMSGTSMSAPQIAGVSALVLQYLHEMYPDAEEGTLRPIAEALMMSTATPIISSDSYLEASPRQQGAGLINALNALTSQVYMTVDGGRPKAELGDGVTGEYTFTFELTNMGTTEKTYELDYSLLTEMIAYDGYNYYMAGYEMALEGTVTFDAGQTVTVAGGQTVAVTATVTLSDYDRAVLEYYWANGGYVEGFVYAVDTDENGVDLSLPFMGFYGDWTEAPVFDTAYWYDNSFWSLPPVNGLPEGDEYWHVLWTDLAGTDWVLGMNPYTGAMTDENGQIIYDPANNVVSPNGDGVLDGLAEIYVSLLRNAKTLTFTYTVDGEVMHSETIVNARKTMYLSNYGQIVPWIYSWYGSGMYRFTDLEGNTLPNGTEVLLTISATVDYADGGEHSIEIPITVDTQAPQLTDVHEVVIDESEKWLVVTAEDNMNIAAIHLMNTAGTQVYDMIEPRKTEDGTFVATFDIAGMGTEFTVVLCDYAGNETYYDVTYTTGGENLPELDLDRLYAYRVFDNAIYSDHMYGWISMNKPEEGDVTADITILTDDYLEYAALTAAEYVDGLVFAVDAVYNLVVMQPGLWNRTTICNIGTSVIDMAFDDSTGTMYMLGRQDYDMYLYTLDIMTGEVNVEAELGYYYYNAPIAITTDDNGTLYAVGYNSAYLYTMTAETGYEMTPVVDAEGNPMEIFASDGSLAEPTLSNQSMVYDNGVIYWAYFYNMYDYYLGSDLIRIDVENKTSSAYIYAAQAYDADNNLVDYKPITELVGLIVLEDTEYQIPEATDLYGILLNHESLILNPGQVAGLRASALPWNYELTDLVWTSSDESVAVVVDGVVTAIGEGTAIITVSSGEASATCSVSVVDISGDFYAYNYYSADGYYGYMINVDLETMDYGLVAQSPVDFLAGDYNGHNGYFYGYTEGGQFYRYDIGTGRIEALGAPTGTVPSDMAYDYSSGLLYASVIDYMSGISTINVVNPNNGQLVPVAELYYEYPMTLACDLEGNLYTVTAFGDLYKIIMDGGYMADMQYITGGLGELQYMQSMCYDHNNDVLLWNYCEMSTVVWMDPNGEFAISLGDPTESGQFEFVGMFVIPNEIPALPEVAVEYAYAEDMLMLTGSVKYPSVTVEPFNATAGNVQWISGDPEVVVIDDNGALVAVAPGTATVTGELYDPISDFTYELSFQVTVLPGADDMYGHVMTDLATYGGQYWIRMYTTDPSDPDYMAYTNYVIYAEEYYNGKVYALGYDPNNWEANWQLFVLDHGSYRVESMTEMDEAYPFVYDMTYDYATSTMYCLAGASSDDANLYVMNMETGELTLAIDTEQMFISLAAGADGKLYAIQPSQEMMDEWTWSVTYTNAMLYAIDPVAGTVEFVADTGIKSNMLSSMAYDYDTGYLYWSAFFQGDVNSSGLIIIDPATGAAANLGTIGMAGAQVSGLYFVCDNFPAEQPDTLHNVLMTPGKTSLVVGETATITAITLPMNLGAEIVWTSSDESIVTVDGGVLTGIGQGKATVTATVTHNGVTKSATCTVSVLDADASFLTYNVTDGGWAAISRADFSVVTNLTEGEEGAIPTALGVVNNEVYGYDADGVFFKLNLETFQRETIATDLPGFVLSEDIQMQIEIDGLDYYVEVRDMEYDVANDRMLVLTSVMLWDSMWEEYAEVYGGCQIYSVDLTTGEMTLLHTIFDYFYVFGMTADTNGNIYYYNTYNDDIVRLDPATGNVVTVVSLQTQNVWGDYNYDYAMFYDDLTGNIYMLFTGNGNYYRMVTVDAAMGTLSVNDGVGYVEMNYDTWAYEGDYFTGLVFVELPKEEPVVTDIVSASLSLNGDIAMNFYATLTEDVLADPDAYMQITVAGQTVNVPVSEGVPSEKDGVVRYRFSVELAAKQMTDAVTAQLFNADGAISEAKTLSVRDYAEMVIGEGSDAAGLMVAMLNYGAAAQNLFGYNTEDPANANLSEQDKALVDVDASEFAAVISGAEDGITAKSATLVLESETTLRIYFVLTGDKTIDQYTFTVDGEEATPVATGEAGKYYVEVTDIAAKDLDEAHTFAVGGLTVTYSGMSFVNKVVTSSEDAALVELAKALYAYNQAANAYFPE